MITMSRYVLKNLVEGGRHREGALFQVITMSKYVLKIIYSALQFVRLEASSYIVITDHLLGAPSMLFLASFGFLS